mmetsp:Transcript_11019/g.18710  ORF Transcript_11019/g.18710 Transcript_11019/m.18710 type:complete len:121 (-) Transcript_11019:123-485(-)
MHCAFHSKREYATTSTVDQRKQTQERRRFSTRQAPSNPGDLPLLSLNATPEVLYLEKLSKMSITVSGPEDPVRLRINAPGIQSEEYASAQSSKSVDPKQAPSAPVMTFNASTAKGALRLS